MTADTRSARIAAPARAVFDVLSDPCKLTLWSFGTWSITEHAGGLIEGRALMSGAVTWLRIDADPARLLIDYHLGADPDTLSPRIFARVIPGPVTGHGPEDSTLLLTALRTSDMSDARWEGLCRAHAFEVDVIRSLIETGHDHRKG